MCVLKRWLCTKISGHKGEILRSWCMQERCHQPSSVCFDITLALWNLPLFLCWLLAFATFLQLEKFSFKFTHYCCSLSKRQKNRSLNNHLVSIWAICTVFRNTWLDAQKKRAEAKRDERGEERFYCCVKQWLMFIDPAVELMCILSVCLCSVSTVTQI